MVPPLPKALSICGSTAKMSHTHRGRGCAGGRILSPDFHEIIDWMRAAPQIPGMTYITHGDPDASDALRLRIKRGLGWSARVPEHLETESLRQPCLSGCRFRRGRN
ncbi:MBL fold metallo-hydrolase RNA specificity domain-containing protein [Arthrobacter sp. Soil736]|uniref:MBL fold metallo-hydrolase RNA specificity domain-containing protein n=1 Tax=Arthrobacter sp. Soil736 TaxID=1736395 RepID=UPI003211DBB9